jgi:hypothetical protein
MLGITLVIVSLLIVVAVLYGHQKRETFTNMKGAFPKWVDVLNQVRKILDEQFEYDAMKFSEFVDKQATYGFSITADEINEFMNSPLSKYLPKNFTLNTDLPFDSKMAINYAKRSAHVAEMKTPTDKTKLVRAYIEYYENNALSEKLKSDALFVILNECRREDIITKLKEKTTFSLL